MKKETMQSVVEKIEQVRDEKDIKKKDVAAAAGQYPGWYSKLLDGKATLKVSELVSIAILLKKPGYEFFPDAVHYNIKKMTVYDLIKTILIDEIRGDLQGEIQEACEKILLNILEKNGITAKPNEP